MRSIRTAAMVAAAASVLAIPAVASAHHTVDHPAVEAAGDAADSVDTQVVDHSTDNVEEVGRAAFPEASDMYFQRREGERIIDGEILTEGHTDIAFIGGEGQSGGDGNLYVYDVTDPTDPVQLAKIPCGGFHAEVVAYENLFIETWDGSGGRCDSSVEGPGGPPISEGVRIFDATDPANPKLIAERGEHHGIPAGVHNATVHPEEGLLYLNMSELTVTDPLFGYIDLEATGDDGERTFPVETQPIREISPTAGDGCHDMGIDYERDLAACAAITESYVWDISDPRNPVEVAPIINNAINIHHGARFAPDGTLVLNDELAGAAAAFGCWGTGSAGAVGALWFYDVSVPQAPVPLGSYSTEELNPTQQPCTSHFYNFIPDSSQLVVGWYRSGMVVVDFSTPQVPTTVAVYDPEGASFWAAYYWRGKLYGASRTGNADAGGLYVVDTTDGLEDLAPAPNDEGLMWGRWSSSDGGTASAGTTGLGEEGGANASARANNARTAYLAAERA